MKVWIKRVMVVALSLPIIGFAVLERLRAIGLREGVEIVSLPAGSKVQSLSAGNDYFDAYEVQVKRPVSMAGIHQTSNHMGRKIFEGTKEIVYEGSAPGLRFLASYHLQEKQGSSYLTLSTVVFYESFLGVVYFTPVKQVHKRGLPYILMRQSRNL